MSEAAVDLERERQASIERQHARLRPSRARAVRHATAEHGGIEEAAAALYKHLGEEELARIAALAASDGPLDDGARRLSREEIETLMATRQKRLAPEDVKRMHEYVSAAREADPAAKAREVWQRALDDLGIDVSFGNFKTTYWYTYGKKKHTARKARAAEARRSGAGRPAAKASAPRAPTRRETSTAPPPAPVAVPDRDGPYGAAIRLLRHELAAAEERVAQLVAALEALQKIQGNGDAR